MNRRPSGGVGVAIARAPRAMAHAALRTCCALLLSLAALAAHAQIATPDPSVCARLAWTTMVTLDSANRTGNYGVLRAMGSKDFQRLNPEPRLAEIFRSLRERHIDVGRAILIEPTYYIPPFVDQSGRLRLRGGFESRPSSLRFDFIFVFEDGGWSLQAISVLETSSSAPR